MSIHFLIHDVLSVALVVAETSCEKPKCVAISNEGKYLKL